VIDIMIRYLADKHRYLARVSWHGGVHDQPVAYEAQQFNTEEAALQWATTTARKWQTKPGQGAQRKETSE